MVAAWQLRGAGMSGEAVQHHTAHLRSLHDGVFLTGEGPLTRRQRWWAAVLSAPGRALAFASAGAAWGFRPWEGDYEVVVMVGSGGPQRFGNLLVCRAKRVEPTTLDGVPITTPERTLADLWRRVHPVSARRKMLREALRLKRTTAPRLREHLGNAPPRNRPATLGRMLAQYEHLRLDRCKSDAEAHAVELLATASVSLPAINERRAGEEADLSWERERLIIEIDGGQFHQDKAEDARKTAIWTQARWTVRRVPTDVVFGDSRRFVALTRQHLAENGCLVGL